MNVYFSDRLEEAAKVADRFHKLGGRYRTNRMSFMMDMMAADGLNGNQRLDWVRLIAEFDDANFMHDAAGIQRHLNRRTGKLEDCFTPRCAVRNSLKRPACV